MKKRSVLIIIALIGMSMLFLTSCDSPIAKDIANLITQANQQAPQQIAVTEALNAILAVQEKVRNNPTTTRHDNLETLTKNAPKRMGTLRFWTNVLDMEFEKNSLDKILGMRDSYTSTGT